MYSDINHQRRILDEANSSHITFILGKNGTGKSRALANISHQLYSENYQNTIAISNSAYTKFPAKKNYRAQRYSLYVSGRRDSTPSLVIKNIIKNLYRNDFKNLFSIKEILNYINIQPIFGISIERTDTPNNEISEIYETLISHRTNYDKLNNENDIDLRSLIEEIEKKEYQSYDERINPGLDYLKKISNNHENFIDWFDLNEIWQSSIPIILSSLINIEKKISPYFKLKIYTKNQENSIININSLSSGESSILSIYSFIALNLEPESYLLIDEPENSLHPEWQSRYCEKLLDLFHRYELNIIISTHSPMVVSGAISSGIPTKIFTPQSLEPFTKVSNNGIDALLMDAFETLTPKNHHLSESAQILLTKLDEKEISLKSAIKTIQEWENKSYDAEQKSFLDALKELAIKLKSNNVKKENNNESRH
ncbi:hypothetical protein Cthiooxydans_15360 [Comamonas thiooxydans]|uniref:AAA family ATPase n=1 Tax=Comamonas thiooxydans TaxID=363952 RepID=UPI001E5D0970|nr:AAA family ATPase [Comamonas thiooxydans]BDB69124.1 hypothetical protein Cthiooxydans_15360 [Comamonas thiooxydans]